MDKPSKYLYLTNSIDFEGTSLNDTRAQLVEELMNLLDTKLRDSSLLVIDSAWDSDASIQDLEVLPNDTVRVSFEVNATFTDLRSLSEGCDSGPGNMGQKNPIDFRMDALQVEALIKAIREHE